MDVLAAGQLDGYVGDGKGVMNAGRSSFFPALLLSGVFSLELLQTLASEHRQLIHGFELGQRSIPPSGLQVMDSNETLFFKSC